MFGNAHVEDGQTEYVACKTFGPSSKFKNGGRRQGEVSDFGLGSGVSAVSLASVLD